MSKLKTKPTRTPLDNSPTHLLHRALQLAVDFHGEAAGAGALTQRQFTVLTAVAAADGVTQNDLVRATGIDRSTLAELVARMLTKGLLERIRSVTDGRANTVRISEGGHAALALGAVAATEADERLLCLLSPKKRDSFLKGLIILAEAADGQTGRKPKVDSTEPESPALTAKVAKKKKSKKIKKSKISLG